MVKSVQNNLSFCHHKVVFQPSYNLCTLLRFKDTLDKKIRFDLIRVATEMLHILVKLTDTFLEELQNIWVFQI